MMDEEDTAGTNSEPGWKLFGLVPPKDTIRKDCFYSSNPMDVSSTCGSVDSCDSPTLSRRQIEQRCARKHDVEVSSTTGLILEPRPVYVYIYKIHNNIYIIYMCDYFTPHT